MLAVMISANPLGYAFQQEVQRFANQSTCISEPNSGTLSNGDLRWESNAICQPANLHKRALLRDLSEWRSGPVAQDSSPVAHATCTPLVPILHRIADVSLLSLWRSSKEYS